MTRVKGSRDSIVHYCDGCENSFISLDSVMAKESLRSLYCPYCGSLSTRQIGVYDYSIDSVESHTISRGQCECTIPTCPCHMQLAKLNKHNELPKELGKFLPASAQRYSFAEDTIIDALNQVIQYLRKNT